MEISPTVVILECFLLVHKMALWLLNTFLMNHHSMQQIFIQFLLLQDLGMKDLRDEADIIII